MKVIVKQHCDEAMTNRDVQDFVTAIYKAAEGKHRAYCTMSRMCIGEPWVELYVGRIGLTCRAYLVDDVGTLAEWNSRRGKFYPVTSHNSGESCSYILS